MTAFFAATTALVQNDLKRVIAYSTCSQLGYMIFACGLSNYSVAIFHLAISDGSEDGNDDEDGGGDRNGIGERGGEAKKRKKPHKKCRRAQALSFRTCHHLCRQGVALAGTQQLRLQGPVPVHAHRT